MQLRDRTSILYNTKFQTCIFFIIIVIVTIQVYSDEHCANLLIYKDSFFNLIHHKDIYARQPNIDLYKYTPTFSLFFAPIALLPLSISLLIWNLINDMSLFLAIKMLPIESKKKSLALLLLIPETVTSTQYCQSNALVAGLIIFSFIYMEKNNVLLASFFIVLASYIKIFPIITLSLFFLYPKKIKFIFYTILWICILFLLPLIVLPWKELLQLYHSWIQLLMNDHSTDMGFSIMMIFRSWLGITFPSLFSQLIGALFLLAPLTIKKGSIAFPFRILYLCSILIWVVIFNHKAESATFVIAVAGMALFFVTQKPTLLNIILISLCLIITSFYAYLPFRYLSIFRECPLKALPPVIIWMVIQFQLYLYSPRNSRQLKLSRKE